MSSRPPAYLGDGVYLSDDGDQLWLGTGHHDDKSVALDRETFERLIELGAKRFADMNRESGR